MSSMRNATAKVPDSVPNAVASGNGTIRRRRRRRQSLESEIRQTAKSIHAQGMAEAMKAATLVIVGRKLDELLRLVAASGLGGGSASTRPPLAPTPQFVAQPPPPPPPPQPKNPCVQCGRDGIYKSKPNQWNRTGSWYCRAHMALAGQQEAEDRMDRMMNPVAPSPAPPNLQPGNPYINHNPMDQAQPAQPAPGASSLSEAMGLAEIVHDE